MIINSLCSIGKQIVTKGNLIKASSSTIANGSSRMSQSCISSHNNTYMIYSQCAQMSHAWPTRMSRNMGDTLRFGGKLDTQANEDESFTAFDDDRRLREKARHLIGFLHVDEGEKFAVWNWNGKLTTIAGPARPFLINASYLQLQQYIAEPSQFLRIIYRDGKKEYKYGPAMLWEDPIEHAQISIHTSITLSSHEAIVVYSEDDDGTVARRIVHGPSVLKPSKNEWIHRFAWHGSDPKNPTVKIPSGLTFTKLRLVPDQLYYDAVNVRTKDDALLTVQLMVFYELKDIEKMLDTTHDPIADFINGVAADVINFSSGLLFEEWKSQISQLTNLDTYQQLKRRAELVGYTIEKVVFRGYTANDTLQQMHNNAIEERTRLKLAEETEIQQEKLLSFKNAKQQERQVMEQQLTNAAKEHQLHLAQLEHDAKLKEAQTRFEQSQFHAEQSAKLDLQLKQHHHLADIDYYSKLRELGVNVENYTIAKHQQHAKIIKFDGDSSKANFHLIDSDTNTNNTSNSSDNTKNIIPTLKKKK